MNADIIEKLSASMVDRDLDAVVALSPENFAYVVGFIVPSQPILRWRHAAAVVTRDGRTALFAVDMEAATVKDLEPKADVWVWEEFEENAMPVLAELLVDLELSSARIGLETDYLPYRDMVSLRALLPDARWEPAAPMFDVLRQIKTPREKELMKRLARITEQSIGDAFSAVGVKNTEMDLAGAVTSNLFRLGAQNFKWLILASGERSQYPNVGPTHRRFEPGDIIRLEVFGVLDGYNVGICRTAVVGEASREVMNTWANIVTCRDIIFDSIRPGASSAQIYRKVAAKFSDLGWQVMSFVGHGTGLFVHEEPYIGRHGDWILEEGMLLGTEPVLLVPGRFGFQVKDLVAVTTDGYELLSDVTSTDELLVVE